MQESKKRCEKIGGEDERKRGRQHGAAGWRRGLLGRNKLARNERQIASELSARSPNVIEARGPS